MTGLVDSEALLHQTRHTFLIYVQRRTRGTYALAIDVSDKTAFDLAKLCLVTLYGSIALVAGKAYTDHGAQGNRIYHFAFGIYATRFGGITRVHTLAADTGSLRGTISIILA